MTRIVADTISCIPPAKAAEMGIGYLPQIIIFGDETFRDDTEMNSRTFLKKLVLSKVMPKTAAPPPALYNPIFEEFSAKGESIVVVCPSADLSGTFRSAETAAMDFPKADIRIVDVRTIGAGLASLVLQASEWAKQGMDADRMVERLKEMAPRERTYFYVDTLEYLARGGRIGNARALVGSILSIKPILTLKDGKTEPLESLRTKKRALEFLTKLVVDTCPHDARGRFSVQHGDAEDEARALGKQIGDALGLKEVPIYELPPAVLVHTGPNALGTSFFIDAA